MDDPGAHDLSSEDEHFSDAQSGISTHPNSPGGPPREALKIPAEMTQPRRSSDRLETPGGLPIPRTVVEKIEPEIASYGEEPGTEAHEKRLADAIPDSIVTPDSHSTASTPQPHTPGDLPPSVERIDEQPSHGEVSGTESSEKRKEDTVLDVLTIERVGKLGALSFVLPSH